MNIMVTHTLIKNQNSGQTKTAANKQYLQKTGGWLLHEHQQHSSFGSG